MIPKEILQKIRRIQITTSRMVSDTFAGKYHSVFKGRGIEFYEVREYVPGDEIRSIDWNVTARTGHPHVKKFIEERELTVILLLDGSGSSRFGSRCMLKSQLAAEVCSVLSFSAIQNNDRVGLIIFTDRIEKFIPPRKGLRQGLRVIREALYFQPQGRLTDISCSLDYLNRVSKRKTVAFIISDFFAGDFKRLLTVSSRRHDIVAIGINDPRENQLPPAGIFTLRDAETQKLFVIDTSDAAFRKRYHQNALRQQKERVELFRSIGIDSIFLNTDTPYENELVRFFRMRQARLR